MLIAWALLLAAWAIGNPPFTAPDEADHYIRAFGLSEGQLIGTPDPSARVGSDRAQVAWTAQAARIVSLPRSFDPQALACNSTRRGAVCARLAAPREAPPSPPGTAVTTVGNYQPLPYLAPALALRAGSSAQAALLLRRVAQALVVLALLAVAVLALRDARGAPFSLLGLLLAVTPMALSAALHSEGAGLRSPPPSRSSRACCASAGPAARRRCAGGSAPRSAAQRSHSVAPRARCGLRSCCSSCSSGTDVARSPACGLRAAARTFSRAPSRSRSL
jgi:hypothetical protein